jgi:hypothetical protein
LASFLFHSLLFFLPFCPFQNKRSLPAGEHM